MNARELALHAYYYGTYPARLGYQRKLAESATAPLGVVFYHRIADDRPNPWSMTHHQFERQIRWLQRHFDLVTLEEIQERIRSGRNERMAVAITFDDGYAENCNRAIPFLLENKVPFTYFVSLDFVVNQRPFPQDVDAGVPLSPNTPQQIRDMAAAGVEIGAHTRTHCDVGAIRDPETMIDEIITAKDELSELAQSPVRYFAFPYGQVPNLSQAAVELVKREGMLGVCSAYGAYNLPGEDPFHIQRFHGDPEFIRFKNWVSVDRRKMQAGRHFQIPPSGLSISEIEQWEREQENTNPAMPLSTDFQNGIVSSTSTPSR